jgi:hypothetical protein
VFDTLTGETTLLLAAQQYVKPAEITGTPTKPW